MVCPALFHHVQAHSGGAAFLPNFNFFSFFGFLWPNPMFFFSMAFFRFCRTSQTCHVVIHSPKPQPSCPPTMWWRSILAGFAIFVPGQGVPACRGRKAGQKGGNCCGMCKVPNTPNLGAKPSALHWALQGPMMPCHALVAKWVGGLHVWGLSLPRVGRLGFANVGLLCTDLVCESAKNGPLPAAKNCKPVAGSARLVHFFSKTAPKKRCLASHAHRGKCC